MVQAPPAKQVRIRSLEQGVQIRYGVLNTFDHRQLIPTPERLGPESLA